MPVKIRIGPVLERLVPYDERQGPLPPLLLLLTLGTGLVDALSYFKLGHVFVANMTGNVVFLGFAAAGAEEFSVPASLTALLAFLIGAVGGGRLAHLFGQHRGRLLTTTTAIKAVLTAVAFILALSDLGEAVDGHQYALIGLLAVAMGMQNAMSRQVAVPDLTTTVLTMTLTSFAAESPLAGGKRPLRRQRVMSAITLFLGAAVGAFVVLHLGVAILLALLLLLLLGVTGAAYRHWSSTDPWTETN
jgi:uncharacterized membrane protein YoaK (UPF0700 family)